MRSRRSSAAWPIWRRFSSLQFLPKTMSFPRKREPSTCSCSNGCTGVGALSSRSTLLGPRFRGDDMRGGVVKTVPSRTRRSCCRWGRACTRRTRSWNRPVAVPARLRRRRRSLVPDETPSAPHLGWRDKGEHRAVANRRGPPPNRLTTTCRRRFAASGLHCPRIDIPRSWSPACSSARESPSADDRPCPSAG